MDKAVKQIYITMANSTYAGPMQYKIRTFVTLRQIGLGRERERTYHYWLMHGDNVIHKFSNKI